MTAQISDQILLDKRQLALVGVNGGELFDPALFGLHPTPASSACWRGFVCDYAVQNHQLVLSQLQVNLAPFGQSADERAPVGPAINGIRPVAPTGQQRMFGIWPVARTGRRRMFDNVYQDLNLKIAFTGGLLAATDFIMPLYVHMGFHPAWKFETVFELIVFNGQVTEIRDVSERLAEIRDQMTQRPLQPDRGDKDADLSAWIASTFRLNYKL